MERRRRHLSWAQDTLPLFFAGLDRHTQALACLKLCWHSVRTWAILKGMSNELSPNSDGFREFRSSLQAPCT